MQDLQAFFQDVRTQVHDALNRLVPESGESSNTLRSAMRWSLFGGGKHFRPALVFASGRIFGASDQDLIRTAAAVEMIHTYSLIHDDLPSMDDDELRRGRETCHVKFGEATAILAGDALQVLAFQVIGEDERLSAEIRLDLMNGLARAAAGMVAGQQLDLEAEGRELSLDQIENIHANKTGALITFSATAGARIAGADNATLDKVEDFATQLGLLFQITDDLLDITTTSEKLGKTAGKDLVSGKATYPARLGLDAARAFARDTHAKAVTAISGTTYDTSLLLQIGEFLLSRES